jgi:hypothetical protein
LDNATRSVIGATTQFQQPHKPLHDTQLPQTSERP